MKMQTKRFLRVALAIVLVICMMPLSVVHAEEANGMVAKVGDTSYGTLAEAIAAVGAGDVVIELLDDATMDYNARDAYGTDATTSLTINGNGHTLTLNQKNSDWASIGLKNNAKLVLNDMTIEKTGYGDTSGAWNTHAIIFSCNVAMKDITVNNSVAVQNGAALNNVTINEANGYYGLWINGNGQTVTVNGGAINATNGGRGIKIADQYVSAPKQVTLSVSGTKFNTAKKAAVLVSSTAGAKITASSVNIENVAADKVNFVWVDEEWATSFGNIEVTGATVAQEAVENFVATVAAKEKIQGYYKTLADALAAAKDGDTITLLWEEGDDPIIMSGAVYGKTVTITGTATVDWSKGNLFVGRGGAGNGTVIFDNAKLTSASNNASTGIHVSGREKNTTNKYDGTLVIKNSVIDLDYLINKGAITLNNGTLTVKNGFSIGGRPASETESGKDATATLNLTNGSKVIVNNHNGMGLGYEAIGVMNIDATSSFETTQSFLVTAKGTMNLAGTAKVAGTLTNKGSIVLTDADATLTSSECGNVTTDLDCCGVVYANGKYAITEYPTEISNLEDLKAFRDAVNSGYGYEGQTVKLTADIDMDGEDWSVNIGDNANATFNGTFDGQNHTISNMLSKETEQSSDGYVCTGLFGAISGKAVIKNLTISNSVVRTGGFTGNNAGIVVGFAWGCTGSIENVTVVDCALYAYGVTGTGAILGYDYSGKMTVKDCTVDYTTVHGMSYVGGVVGYGSNNCTVANSTVTDATVNGDGGAVGGVVGIALKGAKVTGTTVKDVTVIAHHENWKNSAAAVVGCITETVTVDATVENVTANGEEAPIVGSVHANKPTTPVAKVEAAVGNVYYKTFAEAMAAAKDGDTITLQADIAASEVILLDKSLTINGNGHKITSSATRVFRITTSDKEVTMNNVNMVSTAAVAYPNDVRGVAIDAGLSSVELTLNNCSVVFTDASANDWAYAVNIAGNGTGHTLTVNGGTYTSANVINVHGASNTIVVKNATLNSVYPDSSVASNFGACIWVLQKQGSTVTATGNTFNGTNAVAFNLGSGTTLTESNNTDNTKRFCVAKIGTTAYGSLADAFANATAGSTITMTGDDTVSQTIKVKQNVTLDLNGKTITGTDNATGSFAVIEIQPGIELTVNDTVGTGKITLTSANNRGWNAYASVISNQRGKLTVNGGTIEHLGGTDMAYGIDNLTNGKGTYAETVINGGTIKSTYRAIRMFLNGVEADNILTVNGGTITGANKSIWAQEANANANPGKLTVAPNAKLNGDVLLSVNANATKWPVKVHIAAEAVNGSVTATNVPAGYTLLESAGVWSVYTGVAVVGTTEYDSIPEAIKAAKTGEVVHLIKPGTYECDLNINKPITVVGVTAEDGYQLVDIRGKLNITADGAAVKGLYIYNDKNAAYINAKNVLVEGCKIASGSSAFRTCYTTGTVTFKDSTIVGSVYGIHFDGSEGGNIVINNCKVAGWTSFASTIKKVSMTNTTFDEGGYNYIRFYQDADISGCTFNEKMQIDLAVNGSKLNVVNSTLVNGKVEDLFEVADIVNSTIIVDGKKLTCAEITKQPTDATGFEGKTAKVSFEAIGDGLTYTWYYKNAGESKFYKTDSFTSNNYTTVMTEARDGRQIYCVVTDQYGTSVQTDTVTLTMVPVAKITAQPESVVVEDGKVAKVSFTASGDGLTYTWYFKNPGASSFSKTTSFTGNTYSVTMNEERNGRQVYCVVTDKYNNTVKTDVVTLSLKTEAEITAQPKSATVAEGAVAKVSLTAIGDGLTYTWYYKNAGEDEFVKTTSFTGNTYSVTMNEERDGRQVYCVIADTYGNTVQTSTVTLTMEHTAKIVAQPKSVAAKVGEVATVSFSASGDGLTYTWFVKAPNGTDFYKSTAFNGNSYAVTMAEDRDGRQVYCVVTDQYGNSVKTDVATFSLKNEVKITSQPKSAAAATDKTAKVSFTATGDGLTYTWYYKNAGEDKFVKTTSFTSNNYTTVMTEARDGRQIYCVVTDEYGNTAQTDVATLTMLKTAKITAQPKSVSVKNGEVAAISFTATGDGLTYTWFVKVPGGSDFYKTTSFTGNTYSVTMNDDRDGRQVYCVVTDKYGNSVQTNVATMTMVQENPAKITAQPKSVTVENGKTAKVSFTATGDGLTYTWYFKNAGESSFRKTTSFTGNSYSITMDSARDGRQVYCVVADEYGNTVQTSTVTLSMVKANVAKITAQPKSVAVESGKVAKVSFTASGDGLTYTWYFKNAGDASFRKTTSFTGNTYSVTMDAARDGRQVYCVVADKYGNTVQTNTATLSVK